MPDLTHNPTSQIGSSERWVAYYNAVKDRPPRETLLKALEQFDAENTKRIRFAVDLGCGDGRDTVVLLRQGWRVLAVDGEAEAIDRLLNRPDLDRTRLETCVAKFEEVTLPDEVDLINASFCLPFCLPEHFPNLWQKIVSSLKLGGRFSGQLFGVRDSWATNPNATFHTREQVMELLRAFELEWFEEEDHPGKTALGEDKHWHIFHIVARRVQ